MNTNKQLTKREHIATALLASILPDVMKDMDPDPSIGIPELTASCMACVKMADLLIDLAKEPSEEPKTETNQQ